jgi:hypothetical protein
VNTRGAEFRFLIEGSQLSIQQAANFWRVWWVLIACSLRNHSTDSNFVGNRGPAAAIVRRFLPAVGFLAPIVSAFGISRRPFTAQLSLIQTSLFSVHDTIPP